MKENMSGCLFSEHSVDSYLLDRPILLSYLHVLQTLT